MVEVALKGGVEISSADVRLGKGGRACASENAAESRAGVWLLSYPPAGTRP